MMRNFFIALVLLALLQAVAISAGFNEEKTSQKKQPSKNPTTKVSYWHDRERGWFFYERLFFKGEKEPKFKRPPKPQIPWDIVELLPAKELNKLLEEVRDYAVSYPDRETVYDYMKLQKIVQKKVLKFAEIWTELNYLHPGYADASKIPWITPATLMDIRNYKKTVKKIITELKNSGAWLIMFASHDCPYCIVQMKILAMFSVKWNFKNIKIADINLEKDLAAEYEVEILPEIHLLVPQIGHARATSALSALDNLEQGILRAYYYLTKGKIPVRKTELIYELFENEKNNHAAH